MGFFAEVVEVVVGGEEAVGVVVEVVGVADVAAVAAGVAMAVAFVVAAAAAAVAVAGVEVGPLFRAGYCSRLVDVVVAH